MTTAAVPVHATDKSLLGKTLSVHFVLRWLLSTAVLSVLSATIALWSVTGQLHDTLAQQLPPRLAEALQFSFVSSADTIAMVSDELNQDLASLTVTGRAALLQHCRVELVQLLASAAPPSPRSALSATRSATRVAEPTSGLPVPVASTVQVNWAHGEHTETASFYLQCSLDAPRLLGFNAMLALLVVLLMLLLPIPLSQRLPWLLLGIKRHGYTLRGLQQALAIALAPATLRFDHRQHMVCIHGVTLVLPKTPYFYYAWYAGLRLDPNTQGWLLNPATDRPDRASAAPLIALMTSAGGHQKAINDLTEHGLRAKILDQNRNKVKDELCRELGDTLAADYLFESERDPRTARYRYRLTCAPNRIKIVTQAPTSIAHPG